MYLDTDRSGYMAGNDKLALTFTDLDVDVSITLDKDQKKELKEFLEEIDS